MLVSIFVFNIFVLTYKTIACFDRSQQLLNITRLYPRLRKNPKMVIPLATKEEDNSPFNPEAPFAEHHKILDDELTEENESSQYDNDADRVLFVGSAPGTSVVVEEAIRQLCRTG
jgi:hypothetical protein